MLGMFAARVTSGGGGLALLSIVNIPLGSATSTPAVAMPAVVSSGDLVVFLPVFENTTISTPSGWVQDIQHNDASSDVKSAIYSRVCDGSEGGTSITFTLGTSRVTNWMRLHLSGAAASSYLEYSFLDILNVATITPNTLTPTWGAIDTLYVVFAPGYQNGRTVTQYPLPDNQGSYTTISNCNIYIATTQDASGTCDPDDLIKNAADYGTVYTIGIRSA